MEAATTGHGSPRGPGLLPLGSRVVLVELMRQGCGGCSGHGVAGPGSLHLKEEGALLAAARGLWVRVLGREEGAGH